MANSLREILEETVSSLTEEESYSKRNFSGEDLTLLYRIAKSLYEVGDYGQAKMVFTQLILSMPFEGSYWQGLGATLQMSKDYAQALTAWSMASMIDEKQAKSHFHAAECLLSLNQIEEAKKALKEAKERLTEDESHLKETIESIEERWIYANSH